MTQLRSLRLRLLTFVVVFLVVFGLGIGWYYWVEEWTLIESVYMTVITLTTVGFGEVRPLSEIGRLFTAFLILLGAGTVVYGFSAIGEYLLTSGVVENLRRRSLLRVINKMENHIIICGAGRVGQTAAQTLEEMNCSFVLVEPDVDNLQEAIENGWITLEGDATRDETLLEAGIMRARGLLVCTGTDSDSLFIVLSARALNPELFIVARSVEAANEAKMRRAGANKVISPYQIGGRHMASVAVRPNVTEFLDVVTLDSGLELWLEEIAIKDDSPLAGLTVVEADLRRQTGVTLVVLLRGKAKTMMTPDENTRFTLGDQLIVLGTREQLTALEQLVGGLNLRRR